MPKSYYFVKFCAKIPEELSQFWELMEWDFSQSRCPCLTKSTLSKPRMVVGLIYLFNVK